MQTASVAWRPPQGAAAFLLRALLGRGHGGYDGIGYTIFFYKPNIHPLKEYELRKNGNTRFAEQLGVPFIDADYDRDNWFDFAMAQSLQSAEPSQKMN